jgi:hypothetical protein
MFRDLRTTISGIVGALGVVVPFFGVPDDVGRAIGTLGIFLLGVFAKDRSR